jgi:hypothetical protein
MIFLILTAAEPASIFSTTKDNKIFNSVLTKILKMKASFFRVFYFKFSQIFEISNSTGRFLVNRQNWTGPVLSVFGEQTKLDRPVLSVFAKTNQFSLVNESMVMITTLSTVFLVKTDHFSSVNESMVTIITLSTRFLCNTISILDFCSMTSIYYICTSNWARATHTCAILKLENMDDDSCYVQLYFYD